MQDKDRIRQPDEAPTPTVRDVAMALFRQRTTFVVVAGMVLTAAIFYVFAGDRYRAQMKVLVRPGRADAPVSAQESAPLDLTHLTVTEEELNSEVELLRDDEVLRRVVEQTGMARPDWLHFLRPKEGRDEWVERAARRMAKKVQVEPVKKTNLIDVSYASADPRQAAKILQSLADAYLVKHMVVYRPSGEVRFFDQQTSEARARLDEAKRKLLEFTEMHGVVAASQERDLAVQRLSELDAANRQTRIELSETQRRVLELQEKLKSLPERSTTQIRTADNPDLLRALKANLLDLQLKRTQLLTKFEPSHRLVQEVDREIAQAQTTIAGENAAPVRDQTTDKDTHYEWAKSELEKAQVQLKSLQARAQETEIQESAYRARAQQLGAAAVTQEDLQSCEKAAEENYLLYVKKRDDARMADALDQRGIANVAVAEQPVVPALPLCSTWTVLLIGLAASGTAGTGAALIADRLDQRFRTPDDVLLYLNAPVLASLPRGFQGELPA